MLLFAWLVLVVGGMVSFIATTGVLAFQGRWVTESDLKLRDSMMWLAFLMDVIGAGAAGVVLGVPGGIAVAVGLGFCGLKLLAARGLGRALNPHERPKEPDPGEMERARRRAGEESNRKTFGFLLAIGLCNALPLFAAVWLAARLLGR